MEKKKNLFQNNWLNALISALIAFFTALGSSSCTTHFLN